MALDPALPPGGNFDLSHWKLTLPYTNAPEILPTQLVAGFTNDFFYSGPDGAMVFWCPVAGGTGSGFPRSELRETPDPTNDNIAWPGYGSHVLEAQCVVWQLPGSQKTVVGQIHSSTGNAFPLVKLQFNAGVVEALVKESPDSGDDTHFAFGTVGLSNAITYKIQLDNGLLSMTVNGSNVALNVFQTDPAWINQQFYFKAGDYCQDNAGPANEGALVSFYRLNVTHGAASNGPPVIVNVVKPSGAFGFTVYGQDAARCLIQTSVDLQTWSNLATNVCVSGTFDFLDTNAPFSSRRFYRTRQLP